VVENRRLEAEWRAVAGLVGFERGVMGGGGGGGGGNNGNGGEGGNGNNGNVNGM
jgi:hypothetical protein